MADLNGTARQAMSSYDNLHDAMYKKVLDKTGDARKATDVATQAGAIASEAAAAIAAVIGLGISTVADVAALATQAITKVKQNAQGGITDFIAATLEDALLIDISSSDIPIGSGTAGSVARASAIGQKWVDGLREFAHATGPVTGDTAEQGAAALCGIAMLMSANTSFLALIGGLVPQIHLDELKELGEMLEKSLGIGRLTRRALTPLIQNTISKPLDRKYRAQYRQDIIGVGELVKALLRNPADDGQWRTLLQQHGYSDEQIAELIAQSVPRLSESEEEVLTAMGQAPAGDEFYHGKQDGAPPEVRASRLKLLTWKRLASERGRVLSAVLSQISNGFLSPADLDTVMQRLGLPQDEQDLWRQAAGFLGERTRKRLSQGDLLFLYEAAQVTDADVLQWARDEGYSDTDAQRLQLFFELKATAATHTKTGGAAAKAAHLHKEHVAWLTDEITGLWSRPPSTAELAFWLPLLDQGDRTKADVKTELKAIEGEPTAIPPA